MVGVAAKARLAWLVSARPLTVVRREGEGGGSRIAGLACTLYTVQLSCRSRLLRYLVLGILVIYGP